MQNFPQIPSRILNVERSQELPSKKYFHLLPWELAREV